MNVERDLAELNLEPRRYDHSAIGKQARCDCPFCPAGPIDAKAKEPAFSISLETGAWNCHRCGEKGNLYQLRWKLRGEAPAVHLAARKPAAAVAKTTATTAAKIGRAIDMALVDQWHQALLSPAGKLGHDFLTARKIGDDLIQRFKLGYKGGSDCNRVVIPYLVGERCLGVKYRRLPPDDSPRKYDREPGCVLPLFNGDSVKPSDQAAVLVEGELDAIAFHAWGTGAPVVSIPDGADANLKDLAVEALAHLNEILLCTDQDEAGDKGAAKLAERLGAFRCRRVRLPHKDFNDCLIAGMTSEEVLSALTAAVLCGASLVRHVSEWAEWLLSGETESRGWCTGWEHLDKLLGGFRPGELTLLTADTGNGKSTWCLDLARRQAVNHHAVLVISLELGPKKVVQKLLCSAYGKRWDRITKQELPQAVETLRSLPLYVLDKYGEYPVAQVKDEIEYAVRCYGVTLAVVDHLHYALGLQRSGDDERFQLDQAALTLSADVAQRLGIHVLLVMHPAKIRPDAGGRVRAPQTGDLKGSSGPGQYADNVAVLEAKHVENRAVLTFRKVRSELGRCGSVAFAFDPETLRFADMAMPMPEPATRPARAARARAADGKMAAAGGRDGD